MDRALSFRAALPWAGFVALLYLLNYMSRSMLSPLLVSVEQDLQVGHAQATSLLLMQSLGFCITLALSGFLLSRIRPRHMTAVPLAASGCVLLLMPWVQNLAEARLAFFAFGLGAGFYFPAGMATLATLVYPRDWGKTVAVHELAPNMGFILVPVFAQAALVFTDWQGTFALMGGLMVCAGAAFLVWGRGGYTLSAPPSFRGCNALLRNPASWAVILLLTVSMIGEFSIFSILQLYLVNEVDFTPDDANMMLSLSRLATPLAVIVGGWAADRFQVTGVIRFCFAAHAVALFLMALNPVSIRALTLFGVVMQAMSIALLFPSLFKAFALCFPEQQSVLFSLSMPVAGLVSTGAIPYFLGICGQYFSFGAGFMVIALCSAICVFAVSLLRGAGRP